jgi:phthiocerol/phenolphthiocerol synthesis type-I polyketide synthase E
VPVEGSLAHHDEFDAGFFGISASEAALIDPQQRVLLELAWHALEDAGVDPARAVGPIGVFAGQGHTAYLLNNLMPNRRCLDPAGGLARLLGGSLDALNVLVANEKDMLAPRISHRLGLTGPSITVQTACSTSLVAVHLAVQSLRLGECGIALAGGVSLRNPADGGYLYEPGGIASATGRCRPFDDAADGTVFTSGAGVVVLKPLADALRDGDAVYAVIRGSAVNNDGSDKLGFTAPSVTGHAEAVRRALADADVPASRVGYVEAHGTATRLGDPIEVAALTAGYAESGAGGRLLGSIKGNIGHTDVAAGIASLIKVVLALKHATIPPSVGYSTPNTEIDWTGAPFDVAAQTSPWPVGQPCAGVSSLGVGGTNVHMVLEPAPAAEEPGGAAVPGPPPVRRLRSHGSAVGQDHRGSRRLREGSVRGRPRPGRHHAAAGAGTACASCALAGGRPGWPHSPRSQVCARDGRRASPRLPVPGTGRPVRRHGRTPLRARAGVHRAHRCLRRDPASGIGY